MTFKTLRAFTATAVFILFLSSCGSRLYAPTIQFEKPFLLSKRSGAVIMSAYFDSSGCSWRPEITLAKKTGAGSYPYTEHVVVKSKNSFPEVILKEGTYYIVNVSCSTRGSTWTYTGLLVDKSNANKKAPTKYRRAIAKFSIKAGEVINIGQLRIIKQKKKDFTGFNPVKFKVQDMPDYDYKRLREQRPEFMKVSKTRVMTLLR